MADTLQRVVHAMAMPFTVEFRDVTDAEAADAAIDAFHAELRAADAVFSLWNDASVMSRINRGEMELAHAPGEVHEVLRLCDEFRERTAGAFDARRSDGTVDPGGVVKTWAVARGVRHFESAGISDWMVGASGDVVIAPSSRPRRLGIADPRVSGDPQDSPVVDVIDLGGRWRAIATSGGAQNPDHIWDARTGGPARHYVQVSVVGTNLLECDVWATAIAAGGATALESALTMGMAVLVVTGVRKDGTLAAQASDGWPSTIG